MGDANDRNATTYGQANDLFEPTFTDLRQCGERRLC